MNDVQKKSSRASDQVFELVVADVMSGRLEPGSRLTESMLTQRSGLGRGPIREALNRLEERGIVEREPNFSCRVAGFSDRDIIDMINVRAALEALAARLAAVNASDEQIEGIRRHLHTRAQQVSLHASGGDMPVATEIDLGFHDRVAMASGNARLIKILCEDFYSTLRIWRRYQKGLVLKAEEDAREHWRILQAIEHREPDVAEFLMRRHIERIRDMYLQTVRNG